MRQGSFFICLLHAAVCLAARPEIVRADEESADKKTAFELVVTLGLVLPALDTTYESIYTPPFRESTSGTAGQILRLESGKASGFNLAGNFLLREQLGIQVLAAYFETVLRGANSPYEVAVDYISRPPPDYAPVQSRFSQSLPWPDTEGHLRVFTLGGNVLARARGERLTADLSGGLSYFHLSGKARSLGYTRLWLGGHSVLFLEDLRLELALEPKNRVGVNVGGQMSVALSRSIELAVDGRYFYSPAVRTDVSLTRVVQSVEEIEEQMSPSPVEIDPAFLYLGVGLKFKF